MTRGSTATSASGTGNADSFYATIAHCSVLSRNRQETLCFCRYAMMSPDAVREQCPFCRGLCNCTRCLNKDRDKQLGPEVTAF